MTAQSPPFVLQNGSHSAALFRQAVTSHLQADGVIAPGDMAVTAQSTPNMSVQVAAGRMWAIGTQVANVSGGTFSTQGAYFGINDAPATVTIATANATNPRIDVVYVAVQDAFYSGSNNNTVIGVVTGTPAPSPTVPSAPSNAVVLAQVAVAANATSVTNSNIAQITTTTAGQASVLGTPIICTSTTRPVNVAIGQLGYETDTGTLIIATAGTGTSTTWTKLPAATTWTNLSPGTGYAVYVGSGGSAGIGPYDPFGYRSSSLNRVQFRGWVNTTTGTSAGTTLMASALPSAYRPSKGRTLMVPWEDTSTPRNTGVTRCEVFTDGQLYSVRGIGANTYLSFDGLFYDL